MNHKHIFKLCYASTYSVSGEIEILFKCRCGDVVTRRINAEDMLEKGWWIYNHEQD